MVLTAGVMLSPLAVPALAADVDLTVKAPETMPKAGETFEITVEVSQGEAGFYSADLTWAFDSAKMEPVRVINGQEGYIFLPVYCYKLFLNLVN